jgi:hypothetical protein
MKGTVRKNRERIREGEMNLGLVNDLPNVFQIHVPVTIPYSLGSIPFLPSNFFLNNPLRK